MEICVLNATGQGIKGLTGTWKEYWCELQSVVREVYAKGVQDQVLESNVMKEKVMRSANSEITEFA